MRPLFPENRTCGDAALSGLLPGRERDWVACHAAQLDTDRHSVPEQAMDVAGAAHVPLVPAEACSVHTAALGTLQDLWIEKGMYDREP